MAIKHSPGCECCGEQGCFKTQLGWTPSSPYSRGEYAGHSMWQPLTEYLQGAEFLHESIDDNGDSRLFLFRAPDTMTSGPGWTAFEETRYERVTGVDYRDRPVEWHLFGSWPEDQIALEEAVDAKKIRNSQGIVSVDDVLRFHNDYLVDFNVEVNNTAVYYDVQQEERVVDIRLMTNVVMKEDGSEPLSGLVTAISNASIDERDRSVCLTDFCGPSHERDQELVDRGKAPNDPFPIDCPFPPSDMTATKGLFTRRMGYLLNGVLSEDSTPFIRQVTPVKQWTEEDPTQIDATLRDCEMARTPQLSQGPLVAVCDPLFIDGNDVEDVYKWAFDRGGLVDPSPFTPDVLLPYQLNFVFVMKKGGQVQAGGLPFAAEAGDLFRVADIDLANAKAEGGFVHIPKAEIPPLLDLAYIRAHGGQPRGGTSGTRLDQDIETELQEAFLGKKIAVWVNEYHDISEEEESFYVLFDQVIAQSTMTLQNPHWEEDGRNLICTNVLGYECNCQRLSVAHQGVDLLNWDSYTQEIQDHLTYDARFLSSAAVISSTNDWLSDETLLGRASDCDARNGRYAILHRYQIWEIQPSIFDPVITYGFGSAITVIAQINDAAIEDCMGESRYIVGRSRLFWRRVFGDSGGGYPSEAAALAAAINSPNVDTTGLGNNREWIASIDAPILARGVTCSPSTLSLFTLFADTGNIRSQDNVGQNCNVAIQAEFPPVVSFGSEQVLLTTSLA